MRAIFLPIFLTTVLLSSHPASSSDTEQKAHAADSLFRTENFDEAGNVYAVILSSSNLYSPKMLMQLAFIEEQKQNIGSALYYLSLYNQHHPDKKVRDKIITLSEKYNLQGYSFNEWDKVVFLLKKYKILFATVVCLFIAFYGIHLFLKKRKQVPLGIRPFLLIIASCLLLYLFNFKIGNPSAVSTNGPSALMEGPSAASSLFQLIPDGYKLKVTGEADIWYQVQYNGRELYIRKNQARVLL